MNSSLSLFQVDLKFCLPWANLRLLFSDLAQANDLMALCSPCRSGKCEWKSSCVVRKSTCPGWLDGVFFKPLFSGGTVHSFRSKYWGMQMTPRWLLSKALPSIFSRLIHNECTTLIVRQCSHEFHLNKMFFFFQRVSTALQSVHEIYVRRNSTGEQVNYKHYMVCSSDHHFVSPF